MVDPLMGTPRDIHRSVAVYPLVPARSFDDPLTYEVPDHLENDLLVGSLVEVPVGNKMRVGVVSALDVERPEGVTLKKVARKINEYAVSNNLISLAEWIAKQYGCAMTVALALVVPPKYSAHARASVVPERRRQQSVKRLVDPVQGIDLSTRQRQIAEQVPMSWTALAPLLRMIGTTRATIGKLAESGVLLVEDRLLEQFSESEVGNDQDANYESVIHTVKEVASRGSLVELSPIQQKAVEEICSRKSLVTMGDSAASQDQATLLNGITGSGKTEVYLEVIARSLADGKGAIVLVPEIALTPQTARRFKERFPGVVEVFHSGMTKAQKAVAYERVAVGGPTVVVGPRSAVFAPVHRLGVIVIDEEHDSSYKQDSEPRYDARRVAFRRAQLEEAKIVFGSATPRPESWHGIRNHIVMRDRPAGGQLAPVEIVDLREDRDHYPLSLVVQDAIDQTLHRGRKVIVLHNRRGYAVALHCRSCGKSFKCPRCDISLVIHGRIAHRQRLACHHCGHGEPVPERCQDCASSDIARMGAGTEQLEAILSQRWPAASSFRLDADAVRSRGTVSEILAGFAEPGAAMLIGTQMVAKGHDFPDVELAVVVDADAGLAIPDFRAEERAFSLVAQLAGRAGRSATTAEHARVILQTWNPDHAFLSFARTHDVDGFLKRELTERRVHGLPPFTRIARVLVSARSEHMRDTWARAVAEGLAKLDAGPVLGPATLLRINDRERAQVIVTTTRVSSISAAMRRFLRRTEAERRKSNVRVILDIDPQTLI